MFICGPFLALLCYPVLLLSAVYNTRCVGTSPEQAIALAIRELARRKALRGIARINYRLYEAMIDGESRRRSARSDLELAIDRAQVRVDGVRAENQALGDLRVGQPLGH